MNNTKHPIDELFRQKLGQYQVNPTPKAWEKLSSQLNQPKKSPWAIWLRVAAVLVTILALGLLFWNFPSMKEKHAGNFLSLEKLDKRPVQNIPLIPDKKNDDDPGINSTNSTAKPNPQKETKKEIINAPVYSGNSPNPPEEEINSIENRGVAPITTIRKRTLDWELPQPIVDKKLAQTGTSKKDTNETLAYTVTIKSNGISNKPTSEKVGLQIEEKISSINGLLSKVDKGYAQLQDAKNNLFSSLVNITEQKQDNH